MVELRLGWGFDNLDKLAILTNKPLQQAYYISNNISDPQSAAHKIFMMGTEVQLKYF